VASSFPHYGHSGIVEAARELFMQIEGNPGEHGKKCLWFYDKHLVIVGVKLSPLNGYMFE
jgi:hypothetical protein